MEKGDGTGLMMFFILIRRGVVIVGDFLGHDWMYICIYEESKF